MAYCHNPPLSLRAGPAKSVAWTNVMTRPRIIDLMKHGFFIKNARSTSHADWAGETPQIFFIAEECPIDLVEDFHREGAKGQRNPSADRKISEDRR